MQPTGKDFLSCAARWRGEYQGIAYELSWHGKSSYTPEGTWCYYLLLSQEQFNPEDWQRLRLDHEDRQYYADGPWHRHWRYDDFPDLDAHGGWTFGELTVHLGRDGREYEHVKIGCDYGHLWDRESGYCHGKTAIEQDAKHSIDLLCTMFPRRKLRCAYSGRFGGPDEFYVAVNGATVHKSQEEKVRANGPGWSNWFPAETAGVERGA